MMSPLVKALDRFNRKERFWLLSGAIGSTIPGEMTKSMPLSGDFVEKLECELGIKIPEDPWWAFDYHLDWLFAVLRFAPEYKLDLSAAIPNDGYIRGTQEDVDLIVAFNSTVILIEAKVGESWSNAQLGSKMKRLSMIGSPNDPKTYFVLASPEKPRNVESREWPVWAFRGGGRENPFWIPLDLPESTKQWLRVARCDDAPERTIKADGKYWRICDASH